MQPRLQPRQPKMQLQKMTDPYRANQNLGCSAKSHAIAERLLQRPINFSASETKHRPIRLTTNVDSMKSNSSSGQSTISTRSSREAGERVHNSSKATKRKSIVAATAPVQVAVAVHSKSTAMEREHRGEQQTVPNDIVSDGVVIDIAFHPGKDVIATGTIDGDVKLYSYCDGETPQELLHFTHHKKSCRAVKFSEDGELMFTASKDKSIQIVDLETGSIAHKITKAHKLLSLIPQDLNLLKRPFRHNPGYYIFFSPLFNLSSSAIYSMEVIDNYLIATGDDDGVLKVWDFRRETPIFESKQMEEYVSDLAITREKRILLATSGEGSLTVFNVRAKRMEMQSEMMNAELLSLAIVKNGTKIVAGCGEGCLNIFNWNEWGCISDRFPGHPASVDCLVAVNDTVVCSGSLDGVIRAVNILPNRFVGVVGDHNDNPVESLDLARDKRLLASCSHDEKVKFWDISFLNTRKVSDKRKARKSVLNKQLPSSKSKNKNFFKDLMA